MRSSHGAKQTREELETASKNLVECAVVGYAQRWEHTGKSYCVLTLLEQLGSECVASGWSFCPIASSLESCLQVASRASRGRPIQCRVRGDATKEACGCRESCCCLFMLGSKANLCREAHQHPGASTMRTVRRRSVTRGGFASRPNAGST